MSSSKPPLKTNEGDSNSAKSEIWSEILKKANSQSRQVEYGTVVFLGDATAGKRHIVSRIQDRELADNHSGYALEYSFMDVKNFEDSDSTDDVIGRLGLWTVEDGNYQHLLRFAITPSNVSRCAVVLCVNMSEPWTVADSLARWTAILADHMRALWAQVPQARAAEAARANVEHLLAMRRLAEEACCAAAGDDGSSTSLPVAFTEDMLGLEHNLGIPIIVTACKVDTLQRYHDLRLNVSRPLRDGETREAVLNLLQFHLRKYCIAHGASLVFTSTIENKNCDLLLRHVVQRLFRQQQVPTYAELVARAQLLQSQSQPSLSPSSALPPLTSVVPDVLRSNLRQSQLVYVPAGTDTMSAVVRSLDEALCGPDTPLEEVLLSPPEDTKKHSAAMGAMGMAADAGGTVGEEIHVEDEQRFLQRLSNAAELNQMSQAQQQAQQSSSATSSRPSLLDRGKLELSPMPSAKPSTPPSIATKPKTVDSPLAKAPAPSAENAAEFFATMMNKYQKAKK